MSKCQKCREEELAGMACLSCPCSSTFATKPTTELNTGDLMLLDMMQLQNLCEKGNLASTGNRATLIGRLLHSCGPRSKDTNAAPTVELNNNKGGVGFDFKDWARITLGVQINGNSNQSQGSKGPQNKSTPDLNGPEIVKRVEKRLTILESYLRSSGGEQREMLKRKAELLRSKLHRYYFFAKLLPLSKSPWKFAAFTDDYRKQRSNKNPIKLSEEVNESRQQTAPRSREKKGSKGSWVPVGRQHATGNYSVQPSVVKTTDHGQVVQHVQKVRPRGGGGSEAGDEGLTVIQEVHSRTGVKVKGWNYKIVYKLSDENWNKFSKWRGFGGFSQSNLRQVEKKTGAMVDPTNYLDQTISISGDQGAVKKLVASLGLIFRENFGIL